MAVFDLVKNGVACLCNPLKQFFGVKFEERNLAKLSPIGSMRGIVGIDCHSASCNNCLSLTATKPSLEARRKGEMHVLPKVWSGGLGLAMFLYGEHKAKVLNCIRGRIAQARSGDHGFNPKTCCIRWREAGSCGDEGDSGPQCAGQKR